MSPPAQAKLLLAVKQPARLRTGLNTKESESIAKKKPSWSNVALKLVAIITPAVGLILGALIFVPHVSSGSTGESIPGNADTVVFTFSNPTIVPLEDVSFSLAIGKIGGWQGGQFSKVEWMHRTLVKDEVAQIRLEEFIAFSSGYDLTEAEISVVLTYRVWKIPYMFTEEFHYAAKREPDGNFHWFARPAT